MAARKKKAAAAEAAPKPEHKKGQPNKVAEKLRSMDSGALSEELLKLRKEQFALRLQRATGQSVKPDQFGKVRKSIARLKTIAREAQLKAAAAAGVKR